MTKRPTPTAIRPPRRRTSAERPVAAQPRATQRLNSSAVAAWLSPTASKVLAGTVEAVRFAVAGSGTLPTTHGLLLADELHRLVVRELDGGRAEVVGHAGMPSDHTHAHWVPLPSGEAVTGFLIWVPAGLSTTEVAAILAAAPRTEFGPRQRPIRHYRDGLPALSLHLESAGPVATVAPELCGPARAWRSLTPYLPVRHRKRAESLADHLVQDVRRELTYRDQPPAAVQLLGSKDDPADRWAELFRRHRAKERHSHGRPGYALRLRFDEPKPGPLLLGQLSHFGFGTFVPESDA